MPFRKVFVIKKKSILTLLLFDETDRILGIYYH